MDHLGPGSLDDLRSELADALAWKPAELVTVVEVPELGPQPLFELIHQVERNELEQALVGVALELELGRLGHEGDAGRAIGVGVRSRPIDEPLRAPTRE